MRRHAWFVLCVFFMLAAPMLAQTVSFVDETGAAASTYLENTRVRVRVGDPAANTQPWSAETIYVSLSATLSGDFESLGLTETGLDTGVFEGSLALDLDGSSQTGVLGVLETALQAGPPVVRDTLTAQYGSASDTAGLVAGRIELLDDLGRPAAGYTQGDRVTVRVEDHVMYNDPGLRDGVTVGVFVLAVSDEEFVELYETGNATGIFEGSIHAALVPTYDEDDVVGAPVGNMVHAQYSIANLDETLDVEVPLVGSRAEILDGTPGKAGKPAEFVPESAPIRLRVVDGTVGGGSLVDTLQADVSSLLGGDAETVTLAETGAATGVYETELPTAFNFISPTSPGNGRLETGEDTGPPHRFDTLTLSYNGPAGASSDTATTYGSETLFVDEWGNDTQVYAVGTTVFIRVIDYNHDQSGERDSAPVTVFGLTRGDNEVVNLVETGAHTGVFEGSLPIQYGFYNVSPGDGWLEADSGETIEVRHADVLGNTASADRAVIRNADIHFFDEQGRPTHEVMEGGYASIRLYNFPGNNSPWDVDNTFVTVRSLLTGDIEFVAVTETDRNTGIFEGRIRLVFSPNLNYGNGTLEVFNSGAPDYIQDTVTVHYSDITQASATTVGARIRLIDRFGQDAETYAVGDLVAVRVEDHNVDDPQVRQTLEAIIVVNSQAGDVEAVTATETGYDTGVFVGSVPSRLFPSKTPNNHTLEVEDGDRLEARHVWLHAPGIATDDALVTGSSVLFVDAQGQPADSYLEASTAYVRLVYAGGNASPSVDSVAVTVSAAISPDSEILALTETGFDTGIFTGSIRLSLSGNGISPNDGTLQTGRRTNPLELDTLTVTHASPGGSSSDTVALEGSRTSFVDALGNPADEYARGSRAYVRVEDHGFDRPGLYDTVQVTVRSLVTGDQESVTLLETSRDSGVFAGSLPLESNPYGQTYPNPGDGKLQSDAQEEIEATHDDGQGSVSADRARIVYTSVEFIDGAGAVTVEALEGGLARLRVFDPYASYGNPVGVTVKSRYGNDQEYVSLTETSYQSHVFEGTIQLHSVAPGNGLISNGILETSTSGNPEYRGDEVTAGYGGSTARAVTAPSRIRFIDGFGRVVSTFVMGERAGIRVEDHNLDDPTVRRTVTVDVREPNADVESVTLTETGFDTNVYEGSVLLSPPPYGGPGDGMLMVSAGSVIRAEHGNATTPAASVVQASVTGSQVLFVDAAGQPATVYLEGSRAWVRVVDVAANHSSSADSVTVTLRTALGPDVEPLSLVETGGATGVFTGSIPLDVSSLSPNDGRLTTVQDLGTPHEFDTLRAEYNGATVEIATIATISSRTWFVDAFGNLIETYARGSRAYIRVEDHTFDRPGLYDTVQVTVRSLMTGDQETVTLLETARDGGIFEGSLALETSQSGQTYPNPGDGKLQSDANEEIEAVHTDWTGSTSSSDRALIGYASVEFIDAAGVTTFEVLEGGMARLRLFDVYSNPNNSPPGVTVRSRYGNDQEYVTLTETSYQSHVFEGTIQLRSVAPGNGLNSNNVLETSTSSYPEYRGDELTASYGGGQAVAVTRPSRVQFIDGFGRVASSFAVGDPAGVRVEDHNLDDPTVRRTISVEVRAQNSDVESVILTETGFDTNVYEGSIATQNATPASGNSALQVQPGETIEAEHSNMFTPNPTVARATMSGASVLFVDAEGRPAETYLVASRAYVRVTDHSASSGTGVMVTVQSLLGGDSESLVLSETSPSVFEGSVPLRLMADVEPDNGYVETMQDYGPPHEYETLRVTYSSTASGSGVVTDTIGTIGSRTWFVDAFGNLADSYARGSRAYIRVEDHAFERPGLYDTVQVTVRSLMTGDQETLALLETTRDSGIFEGSVALDVAFNGQTYPHPGDGKLQADANEEIEAVHDDGANSSINSSDRAQIGYASVELVDEAGQTTFEVLEGGVARLRVFDPYGNYGPIGATVRSRYGNDQEYVVLTETSFQSHVFEGTIELRSVAPGNGLPSNNVLETSTSGYPAYLGEELTASYGGDTAQAVTLPSRVRFIDGFGRIVSTFAVGDPAGVRVEDNNLDDPTARRTVAVQVRAQNGDAESLTLTETGFDTNVYEGSIATQNSTPANGNSALQVQPGETIEAEHANMTTPNPTVARATMAGASVVFLDAQGRPAETFLESTRAYVRVTDVYSSGASSVTVRVESVLGGDSESLALSRTGPSVFEGSILLRQWPSVEPNGGYVETRPDNGPPQEFDSLRVIYQSSSGVVTDTAGTIGSRTWFLDAFGNPADSYARGSRAYIRVEDHNFDRPALYDTVQVTVRSLVTGDQETLTLLETARDSGIFQGSLPLDVAVNGQTYPNPGDGKLQSEANEEIEAAHDDSSGATASSDRALIGYASVELVDEGGRTTFEVLEGGVARLRVFEPYGSGPIGATVRSRYGNDQEYVALTETSFQSHVYEGTIELRSVAPGNGLPSNSVLETSTSGFPAYLGDELTASYGGDTAQAVTLPSRVRFIDGFGRAASTFAVGDPAGVRVEDNNLDDPTVRRTVAVQVRAQNGDVESLTLMETGFDTNVYEGSIATQSGTPASGNNALQVLPGETIEAEHANMTTPNPTVAQATMAGASVLFLDAAGRPAETYLEASRAYVRVTDHGAGSSVTVTVQSLQGGDSETLVLGQAGPSVYEGSVPMRQYPSVEPNSGFIETRQDYNPPYDYDTLKVTYLVTSGGAGPVTDTVGTIGSRTSFVDAAGNPAESYAAGSAAYLRVEFPSDDRPGIADTVQATVRSLITGDVETVTLQEIGLDGGIFQGPLPLQSASSPAAGDGRLQSQAGEEIEAVFAEWGGVHNSSDRARILFSSIEIVDGAGAVTGEVLEGGMARLRVFDVNGSGSIGATVRSRYGNDQESVTLTETAYQSHIYEGTFQLRSVAPGNGLSSNNILETSTSGFPEYRQDEVTASYGGDEALAVTVPSRAWFVNLQGQAVTEYAVGSTVRVRVEDHNASGTGQIVTANLAAGADSESLTLTETGTGLFEGSIPSSGGSGVSGNGVLEGAPGILITAEHGNVNTPSPTRAQAIFNNNSANHPPTPAADSATTPEDQAVNIPVLANDTDPDNDTLLVVSVTAPSVPGSGTAVLELNGSVTFTPAADWSGQTSFSYTVQDPGGLTATAMVTVIVTSGNDAPVASDDTATTPEDTPVTVAVLANDSDPDNDTLSVSAVTQGTNGSVAIVGGIGGGVRYTPNANFHGTDSFTYTASDGNGGTDTATVTVTASSENDAPVASDDSATVGEDSSVSIAVKDNDTDADGDTLDVTAVTQGANGEVVLNADDTVTYTPNASFHGSDSFTYTVVDGNGGTDTATVTVTVTSANDAPTATDDTATTPEDTPVTVSVLANDTDVDGDTLTVSGVTQGTNGSVAIVGSNQVTYTPNANFHGTDSFTYTANDGNGGTDTATVTVTINPTNDAPVADDDAASVVEDDSAAVAVLGNDSDLDGDSLTITAVTQGAHGAVAIAGSNVTYTPAPNYNGADAFTYTISDGNGGTDTATVTMTVTASNDALTAVDDAATVAEDGSVTVAVLANDTDPENDPLTVVSVTQGTNGAVAIVGNQVTYTPNANFNGTDSFTYTASDGNGGTGGATVTVTVTPVNDAPVAGDDTASVVEDGSVSISVLGDDTDVDGDTLAVTAVTQGAHGAVAIAGTSVTYTPAANFNGTDSFTYTVSDGNSGTDTATVTVTVGSANDAPVANGDSASTAEDTAVNVSVLANDTDLDGDTLSVASVTQGANGGVSISGIQVVYTPGANFFGSDSFTYTVSDGNGGSATATVTVTISSVNDAPVAAADAASVAEDGSVTVSVRANDTDVDGDTLTITAVTQGAHGAVTHNGSTVTYTPAANYNGSDSFSYTISDGNGGSASASVAVTVTPVNDAPVAVNDTATTLAEVAATVNVRANDTDIDSPTLTVTAVTQGVHGTVSISSEVGVTYTPAAGWVGPDAFTYTISDGSGGTATAAVNVTVQAPPRVTGNLQVLYTFYEGSGTLVHDVSGVGTAYNLTIGSASAVTWLPGALSLNSPVLVQNAATATKVINACKTSNEVTMEAWVAPDNITQTGPAAIASIAQNTTKRNVTLGQSGTAYNGQLKTSTTGNGGTQLDATGVATTSLKHVVYTRTSTGAVRIYVNGTQVATATLTGNLSGWTNYNLALGGEPNGARYWVGDMHLVAIYSRALTASEVRQNWLSGAN